MKYVIGNWKMQLSEAASTELAKQVAARLVVPPAGVTVVVCPSFSALEAVHPVLVGKPIALAAQDVFWEEKGAYTGEVSPLTLKELGVEFCLVGHSERRQHLGETDEMVNKKVHALLGAGIHPVICVGETADERAAGKQDSVVITQVRSALAAVAPVGTQKILIAYEPRWAIGTGKAAAPADAAAMHSIIRETMYELLSEDYVNRQCAILYGGSVDATNVAGFLAAENVHGVLAGGAALKAEEFAKLVEVAGEK